MLATSALLWVLVLWLAMGLGAGLVMGRRGHDPFGWLLLGAIGGPLVLPWALASERHPERAAPRRLVAGRRAGGRVDVLVGIDGSPQAAAALDSAVELLGSRLGRLSLAAVTDLDATVAHQQEEARLRDELQRQASRIQARLDAAGVPAAAELVLLAGPPAQALTAYALAGGYGLLAVGTRGAGLTHRLLGSVAGSLAASTRVPVLLAGGRATAHREAGVDADAVAARQPVPARSEA
jgi:nucleotide-binding universal stress UspA family protein